MRQGVELAIDRINGRGGAGGHPLEMLLVDSAAARPDTLSMRQAVAAAYERFVADPTVIAAVGPQTSIGGRAIAPVLSRANLATITPSATTFDITDAGLKDHFRPEGRAVFFRTVGTDLTQAGAMARFAHAHLGVRRIVLIEDGSDFGKRVTDAFSSRAGALGITVLDRWMLGWLRQDYREGLRRLGALRPGALYLGVGYDVGVKLARQIPDVLPSVHVLGAHTLFNRAFTLQARAPGAEGWFVAHVAPDLAGTAAAAGWAAQFRTRFGVDPSSYSLTAYTAVTVIADAIERLVRQGQPVTRARVRDAIQATRLPDTPAGPIAFDPDGDLERPSVSIYQVKSGAFHHVETLLLPGTHDRVKARAQP
jgi:branched-chain amino acid transport system substrate-binding protein